MKFPVLTRRTRPLRLMTKAAAAVVLLMLTADAAPAGAWPSGGVRAISGKACILRPAFYDVLCSYTADGVFPALENGGIYVDYHVTGGPAMTETRAESCYTAYFGTSQYCNEPSSAFGNGAKDLWIKGFSHAWPSNPSQWDYFYVLFYSWNLDSTVDAVYGLSFMGS